MIATTQSFAALERTECKDLPNSEHAYNRHHFLRDMNDAQRRAAYENARHEWQAEATTVRRLYERSDWSEFVPTIYLDGVLEHTSYRSTAENLAQSITVPSGLTFVYREYENFQRAQRGAENTEFERKKGQRRTQEVPLHTLGVRSYATEEEILDVPVDTMRLELNAMGASIALERDLLWVDSLYNATSGDNALTFQNEVTLDGVFSVSLLHLVLQFFTSPFDTDHITPLADISDDTRHLMRLGRFRATDVLVSPKTFWQIVDTDYLQAQHIWNNSRILDTGDLQVPLLGVNIHKVNMGHFTDPDDVDSWIETDDIIVCDRRMGGTGTIGVRQPLQVRNWDTPAFRTTDFMLFERVGFAVQNRYALLRIVNASGS